MKWLILNKIDYLERYLEFNLKKRANDIFLYYKLNKFDENKIEY